ncbi:MAG: hypothetical protein AAFQ80_06945 [Cyanobacteria bacterium J06621_8]
MPQVDQKHCYDDLAAAIHGVCQQWCMENGYSDLFCRNGEWWAFPPNAVMPVCLKEAIPPDEKYRQEVKIGRVSITLLPDGSFAKEERKSKSSPLTMNSEQ